MEDGILVAAKNVTRSHALETLILVRFNKGSSKQKRATRIQPLPVNESYR